MKKGIKTRKGNDEMCMHDRKKVIPLVVHFFPRINAREKNVTHYKVCEKNKKQKKKKFQTNFINKEEKTVKLFQQCSCAILARYIFLFHFFHTFNFYNLYTAQCTQLTFQSETTTCTYP